MAISDLYTSGAHKRNLSHFANIVKLAVADEVIVEEEQLLIDRLKRRLEITDKEYNSILENPNAYPINPPVSLDARIERLYNLTTMIVADHSIDDNQVKILDRIVIGLGFSSDFLPEIVETSFLLIQKFATLDEFEEAIKKVIKL
ncbi:MAG: TerB family tellurite resistance protein [Flavobacteriales bacterium]